MGSPFTQFEYLCQISRFENSFYIASFHWATEVQSFISYENLKHKNQYNILKHMNIDDVPFDQIRQIALM